MTDNDNILKQVRPHFDRIPDELKALAQWVLWRIETRDAKPTKVPYSANGTRASATDPRTWMDYEDAVTLADDYDGIGFVFTEEDPYAGFDIDGMTEGDNRLAFARMLHSYTERSQSGKGLHVIVQAKKPGERCKNTKLGVELYDNGRFFCMTGDHIEGFPETIEERQGEIETLYSLIFPLAQPKPTQTHREPQSHTALPTDDGELWKRMFTATNGPAVEALYNGDWGRYDSQSDADMALMNHLAFWTCKDTGRMERMFGQSALGQRSKWTDRADYRQGLVAKALADVGETYSPNYHTPRAVTGQATPAPDNDAGSGNGRPPAQKDLLLDAALPRCDLYIGEQDQEPYAVVVEDGMRKTFRLRSNSFNGWLTRLFYTETGKAASNDAISTVKNLLSALAQKTAPVFMRTGHHAGKVYIDLGDETWRAVEVDAEGWRIVDATPVIFYRSPQMHALPTPTRGASLDRLAEFLNADEESLKLLAVTLPYMLHPFGPFPVLVMTGQKGSAKSTGMRVIQKLIDPRAGALQQMGKDPNAIAIRARNSWVLSYENVTSITPEVSDALCSVATGGGYGARMLYTDTDETSFDVRRPIMLNGITDFVNRPDLMDRAVPIQMQVIGKQDRVTESEFWRRFEQAHAGLLGALLEALSIAMNRLPDTHLEELPRLADFATFGEAAQPALPPSMRGFLDTFSLSQDAAQQQIADSDVMTAPLQRFLASQIDQQWTGTASALLDDMNEWYAKTPHVKPDNFPATATWMGRKLAEMVPVWDDLGTIEAQRGGSDRRYTFRIPRNVVKAKA